MFSYMMELTLSSVSHTKIKVQFHLFIYTLSTLTEEKINFQGMMHSILNSVNLFFFPLVQQDVNLCIFA